MTDDEAQHSALLEHRAATKSESWPESCAFEAGFRAGLAHARKQAEQRECRHAEGQWHLWGRDDAGVYHPPCAVAYDSYIMPAFERIAALERTVHAAHAARALGEKGISRLATGLTPIVKRTREELRAMYPAADDFLTRAELARLCRKASIQWPLGYENNAAVALRKLAEAAEENDDG